MKLTTQNNQKPRAIFTMGLPAAGKSFILNRDFADFLEKAVHVDPDEIKKEHPDYDPDNPQEVHEWSKKKARKKMNIARAEGKDIVVDGTGTNLEKMLTWVREFQIDGYIVELVYVKVTLNTSLERNRKRDRTVPEHIVREKAEYVTTSFDVLSGEVDEVTVINND